MSRAVFKLVATCGSGLEELVREEIVSYGGEVLSGERGAVVFSGTLETAYRACLWSRFSARVLLVLDEFPAPETESLYRHLLALEWQDHLGVDSTFAVDCTIVRSAISHSHFAALRVKDAIVDFFQGRFGSRPSVDTRRPDVRVNLFLHKDRAVLSLDLSGESLHRRGYRAESVEAPLKESLAAAIVALAGWGVDFPADGLLLDPMCGSGTLLIEAALMYGDVAPGHGRSYYGFLKWRGHDRSLWDSLMSEAVARWQAGRLKSWPRMVGHDADRRAVAAARKNVEQAGFADKIHIERRELAWLGPPAPCPQALVVVNPPYGERLSEINEVKYLYRCLGRKLRENFAGCRAGIFIGNPDLADTFGLEDIGGYRLYNGPLACQLRVYSVPEAPDERIPAWNISREFMECPSNAFANRLRKNLKKLLKWASKEEITCLRIYDADIPEYNVAVDLYGQWAHVQEYKAPEGVDKQKAAERLREILKSVKGVLGITRNRIFLKVRQRQRGKQQYQKKAGKERFFEVREWNCRFLVNFSDYLDTGLFLDHRFTRKKIGRLARDKKFLNLFAYTGSATVHAALGGARSTTSVDLSASYLAWLKNNLALNGLGGGSHRIERSDVLAWLKNCTETFDLIFVDPPTFSNTKKQRRVFDLQRDQQTLLRLAMKRLTKGGLLIFSTNFRRFKLAPEITGAYIVDEITSRVLPLDFSRRRVHRCWEIRHHGG